MIRVDFLDSVDLAPDAVSAIRAGADGFFSLPSAIRAYPIVRLHNQNDRTISSAQREKLRFPRYMILVLRDPDFAISSIFAVISIGPR